MNTSQHTTEVPVTVTVSRQVRPGKETDFKEWISGITRAAITFDGYLGVNVLKPSEASHDRYVVIFRFDTYDHLQHWEESPVRNEWLKRVEKLTVGDATVKKITGIEYWFTIPNQCTPPPRYKMAAVTALAIFPLVNILGPLFQWLLGGFPALLRSLLLSITLVLLMTYLVMPFMSRLFAFWLFKAEK